MAIPILTSQMISSPVEKNSLKESLNLNMVTGTDQNVSGLGVYDGY